MKKANERSKINFILQLMETVIVKPYYLIPYVPKSVAVYYRKPTLFVLVNNINKSKYLLYFTLTEILIKKYPSLALHKKKLFLLTNIKQAHQVLNKLVSKYKQIISKRILIKIILNICLKKRLTSGIFKVYNIPTFIYDRVLMLSITIPKISQTQLLGNFQRTIYLFFYMGYLFLYMRTLTRGKYLMIISNMVLFATIKALVSFNNVKRQTISYCYEGYPYYSKYFIKKSLNFTYNKLVTHIEYQVNLVTFNGVLVDLLWHINGFINSKKGIFKSLSIVIYIFNPDKQIPREVFMGYKSFNTSLDNLSSVFINQVVANYDSLCQDDSYNIFTKNHLGFKLFFRVIPIPTDMVIIEPYIYYENLYRHKITLLKEDTKKHEVSNENFDKAFLTQGYKISDIDFPV